MKSTILTALLGTALTAACNQPAAEPAPPPPAADAAPAPAPETTPAVAVNYECVPTMSLAVVYDDDAGPDGQARVTLDGREFVMNHVQAGSGARYETDAGRSAGKTLVWWNQGGEGLLLEGSTADEAAEEVKLATCTQTPAP